MNTPTHLRQIIIPLLIHRKLLKIILHCNQCAPYFSSKTYVVGSQKNRLNDKSTASNYMPISLTCMLCEVLENIVVTNLVTHIDSYQLLYGLQHGVRSKRSRETQLVMLVEDLSRNAIKGQQTDLILLDFFRAFEKVSHEKLLLNLHHCGIRGRVLN